MSSPTDLHPDGGLISAFLDGEAAPEERARVEEHLRTCQRCRELADDFRSLAAATTSEEPPPVPADLPARIGGQVEAEVARRRPRPRPAWRSPFALAAAGVAVATLVWIAMGRQPAWRVPPPAAAPPVQNPALSPALEAPADGSEASRTSAAPPAAAQGSGAGIDMDESLVGRRAADGGKPGSSKVRGYREQKGGPATGEGPAPQGSIQRGTADVETENLDQPGNPPPRVGETEEADENAPVPRDKKGEPLIAPEGRTPAERTPAPSRQRPKRSSGPGLEAQLSRESALESSAPGAAAGPRILSFETPATTLTISEDGSVTLIRRGYACSTNVAAPAAPGEAPSLPPQVTALFARATSREVAAAVARMESAGAPTPEEEEARSRSITLRKAEGGVLYAVSYGETPEVTPPLAVLDLEADIKAAAWLHLRKTLEERCGPVPGVPPGTIP